MDDEDLTKEAVCPFCGKKQSNSIKNWKYSNTEVNRYKCKCGKMFNMYQGKKSTWTIPKGKKDGKTTKA